MRTAIMLTISSSKARYWWLLALLIVVLLVDLVIWLAVLIKEGPASLVRVRNPLWFLGCAFLVMAAVIAAMELLKPHAELWRRLLGALLILSLVPSLRAFQLYTDMGVFFLDGSEYWVDRAARTGDPDQAKAFLAIVLSATQYGVNEAEHQVLANYAPHEQVRLFRLLSEIAPNENWRNRYLARGQGRHSR